MSTQAELVTKLQTLADSVQSIGGGLATLKTNLETSVADLVAQINALKNSQPNLDLTSLDASIASLTTNVASITGLSDEAKAADPGPVPAPPPVNP